MLLGPFISNDRFSQRQFSRSLRPSQELPVQLSRLAQSKHKQNEKLMNDFGEKLMNEWGKKKWDKSFRTLCKLHYLCNCLQTTSHRQKKHEEIMDHHNAAGLFHGCASSTVHHRLRP